MSKINIYAAVADVSDYLKQKKDFLIYSEIVKKYWKKAKFWNKVLYYFAEKEIKEAISKKINQNIDSQINSNLFFDSEINSLVHRSHIEYYFPLANQTDFKTQKIGKEYSILNREVNDFVLSKWKYLDESKSLSQISFFLTNFIQNEFKIKNAGSDILSQLLLYRENVKLVKYVLDSVENQNLQELKQKCLDFVDKYQEFPFVVRLINWKDITEEVLQKVYENSEKFKFLLEENYHVVINKIKLSNYAWTIDNKKNIYNSWLTKVWLFWKNLSWWIKILITLIVFWLTAYFGGIYIIALVIFVFIRQFLKTKADLYESHIYNINKFLSLKPEILEKLNNIYQNKTFLNNKQKNWFKKYYTAVPEVISKYRISADKALIVLNEAIKSNNKDKIFELICMLVARLWVWYNCWISLFYFEDKNNKELTLLKLYKSLILWWVIVGLDLSNSDDINQIQSTLIYQDIVSQSENYLKESLSKYKKHSYLYSAMDWFVSAVVAWFTWWLSANLLHPAKTFASMYASDTTTKIVLDKNSPLWDLLSKNWINSNIAHADIEKIKSIIKQDKNFYFKWNDIYQHWWTILDPKLSDLDKILPKDVENKLLNLVKTWKTDWTLRDTMVRLSWKNWWNEFTQRLVDELRKAQDSKWLSELFQIAHHNWLPLSVDSEKRDRIINILNRVYNPKYFPEYHQFVDKHWLAENLQKIVNWEVDVQKLSHYTEYQRSVLSQTAFIYVHKPDFFELFYDKVLDQKVWELIQIVNTEHKNFFDNIKFDVKLPLKSVPLTFGRNRIFEELDFEDK